MLRGAVWQAIRSNSDSAKQVERSLKAKKQFRHRLTTFANKHQKSNAPTSGLCRLQIFRRPNQIFRTSHIRTDDWQLDQQNPADRFANRGLPNSLKHLIRLLTIRIPTIPLKASDSIMKHSVAVCFFRRNAKNGAFANAIFTRCIHLQNWFFQEAFYGEPQLATSGCLGVESNLGHFQFPPIFNNPAI